MSVVEFEPEIPGMLAAADLRLTLHGHRDRLHFELFPLIPHRPQYNSICTQVQPDEKICDAYTDNV
jgi:hypothetical protein